VTRKRIHALTANTAPETSYCLPIDRSGAASAQRVTIANLLRDAAANTPMQIVGVLAAGDGADDDAFGKGMALAADGSVLAVGARTRDGAGALRGGVYIFDWSGAAWVQRGGVLEAADTASMDQFGASVALSADGAILAVGANGRSIAQGGVYIFDWSGTAWVQRGSVVEAPDKALLDAFGASVALSADGAILAVGASAWEGASGTNRGGVYIFDWSGTAWVQRGSVIEAADAANNAAFGASVALSADGAILAVGANEWPGGSESPRGGVYVYDRFGAAWTQRGNVIEAADAPARGYFGTSVALSADGAILAVGATGWEGPTGIGGGGISIFDWSGAAWAQRGSVLAAADAASNDTFGKGAALSADGAILAVGATGWEGVAGSNRGGVYTYSLAVGARPRDRQPTGAGWASPAARVLAANVGAVERERIDSGGSHVANGVFAALGDARGSRLTMRRAISSHTNTTWYDLWRDGVSGELAVAADTLWQFEALVVGLTSGAAQRWAYRIVGAIVNDGGSTSLVGTPTVTTLSESDAAYDCQAVADNTNDALDIQVRRNGGSDYSVRWVALVDVVAVAFP
jgi:hypothetical protein